MTHQACVASRARRARLPGYRYWARSYALSLLREHGDIHFAGGWETAQQLSTRTLEEIMRRAGYVQVLLYEDGEPDRLLYPDRRRKHVPDSSRCQCHDCR